MTDPRGCAITVHYGETKPRNELTAARWSKLAGSHPTLAVAALTAGALLFIVVALIWPQDFRCRPGDVATTNGRDLCPAHSVPR